MKCIVEGCTNRHGEGRFVGDICAPCYAMITTGKRGPSFAWFAKPWVSLTDKEIDTWNIVGHESLREFVRAIEAKLKEKNR